MEGWVQFWATYCDADVIIHNTNYYKGRRKFHEQASTCIWSFKNETWTERFTFKMYPQSTTHQTEYYTFARPPCLYIIQTRLHSHTINKDSVWCTRLSSNTADIKGWYFIKRRVSRCTTTKGVVRRHLHRRYVTPYTPCHCAALGRVSPDKGCLWRHSRRT